MALWVSPTDAARASLAEQTETVASKIQASPRRSLYQMDIIDEFAGINNGFDSDGEFEEDTAGVSQNDTRCRSHAKNKFASRII